MSNVVIKEEPIEEDIDEEKDFTFSMDITTEEAADAKVKLEEVFVSKLSVGWKSNGSKLFVICWNTLHFAANPKKLTN